MIIKSKIAVLATAVALASVSSVYAATPVNITASDAQSGNPASNTVDGSLDSRWSSQGEGQWIQYDFGEPVTLEAVKIAFFKGDSRSSTFQIESSDDASNWVPQPMGQADGSSAELQSYSLTQDTTAQYFRIVGFGNSSNNWNSITEVAFVDGEGEQPIPVIPGPIEICSVSASTDDGNVADNVLDGDLSTRWSANGSGQWVQLNLCEEAVVNAVDVAFFKGDSRSSTFDIETSTDGSSWSEVITNQESASNTVDEQTFTFTEVNAKYVRYVGYGNSSNTWNSLTEFSATACEGDSCEPVPCEETDSCPIIPCEETNSCPIPIIPDDCAANGQITYNGECAEYSEVYDAEHGDIGEEDHLISLVPIEMTFDALAAKHTTPNGNGWRHELKIKSSGGYRVAMTEVYELFKAKIHVNLDKGAKTIVAQHHASDTGTITKLYVADLNEGGFENAPDGTESDSTAMNGIFDVYIRLAKEDGSGETKHLLTTVRSGESFYFEEENDHGVITVKINGQELSSVTIEDSTESYFKFGNYHQAQNPETNEKLSSSDQDSWPAFYAEYFDESKITFTEMSYIRNVD